MSTIDTKLTLLAVVSAYTSSLIAAILYRHDSRKGFWEIFWTLLLAANTKCRSDAQCLAATTKVTKRTGT
jgi:hypothetical protein